MLCWIKKSKFWKIQNLDLSLKLIFKTINWKKIKKLMQKIGHVYTALFKTFISSKNARCVVLPGPHPRNAVRLWHQWRGRVPWRRCLRGPRSFYDKLPKWWKPIWWLPRSVHRRKDKNMKRRFLKFLWMEFGVYVLDSSISPAISLSMFFWCSLHLVWETDFAIHPRGTCGRWWLSTFTAFKATTEFLWKSLPLSKTWCGMAVATLSSKARGNSSRWNGLRQNSATCQHPSLYHPKKAEQVCMCSFDADDPHQSYIPILYCIWTTLQTFGYTSDITVYMWFSKYSHHL